MNNTPMNNNAGYPPAYNQIAYDAPPMMAPSTGAPIIIHNGSGGTACPACGHVGNSIPRYTMGCVAWSWCCALFWGSYFLWLIPMCSNTCKDIEQLCDRCGSVKGVIPASCC
jgi:hypothetical protein